MKIACTKNSDATIIPNFIFNQSTTQSSYQLIVVADQEVSQTLTVEGGTTEQKKQLAPFAEDNTHLTLLYMPGNNVEGRWTVSLGVLRPQVHLLNALFVRSR